MENKDRLSPENCNYEQAQELGVPASEYKSGGASGVGRYVDIPVEAFGYPSEYDKSLEERRRSYKDSSEAAEYNNNEVI